jgi:hypothetical protein
MDSLSVGIRVHSIDCDGETWTRVNTDPRDDLCFPDALFLAGGGWPGSNRNAGRHQIGTVAAIKSEYLATSRWNPQLLRKVFTTSGGVGDCDGGYSGWWLLRQLKLELLDQEPEFWVWVGVAGQQQLPGIGCGEMDIDHLDGGKFLKRAARGQPWRQGCSTLST